MEMLCSLVAFHAGGPSFLVNLRNLLGTTLVLRVVFNLKTKLTPSSRHMNIIISYMNSYNDYMNSYVS